MTDIDTKALALRVAAKVCHKDQMVVWSSEVAEALQDFISDDLDYSDIVSLHSAIERELRGIVKCALEHPETERALAAFLREAVSEPAKITPEQLSRAMRPDIWADDCRNMVVPREGQDEDEVVAIVRETHLRWAEDAISRLYPPPPARIEDAEEPSHGRPLPPPPPTETTKTEEPRHD